VTPKTAITSDKRPVALNDLSQYTHKEVTVRFIPERQGDIAQAIRIGG
jgi:hypothetical protein